MNIVVPMAGNGSRFQKQGYTLPKPLIDINGKPMIERVLSSINIQDANYIFLVRMEHITSFHIDELLQQLVPNCTIIPVEHLTEGAACTVLLSQSHIDNQDSLFIVNSDQIIKWDTTTFLYEHSSFYDGSILCFYSTNPECSFVQIKDDLVTKTAEKQVISNHATVGAYYWSRGCDYVYYANDMIRKKMKSKGEYYVAPVYNLAIQDGLQISHFLVDEMWNIGTPEGLQLYLDAVST